jgi:hypothetical protein
MAKCCPVLQVHECLGFALCSASRARALLGNKTRKLQFFSAEDDFGLFRSGALANPNLKEIVSFCDRLFNAFSKDKTKIVIVCAGQDSEVITNSALLVGSFMILRLQCSLPEVVTAFHHILELLSSYDEGIGVLDCWEALQLAADYGWLRTSDAITSSSLGPRERADSFIDMDEYEHYDNACNGNFHIIIPPNIIAFHSPCDIPSGRAWEDSGGVRRFGPDYYADVFADFDVRLVVRGARSTYDTSAFVAGGITVEDLPIDTETDSDTDGESDSDAPPPPRDDDAAAAAATARLLPRMRHVDRFIDLARLTPGAIAVHGGPAGLGAVGILLAALLVRRHSFTAAAAVAWLRLVHPEPPSAAAARFALDAAAAAASAAAAAACGREGPQDRAAVAAWRSAPLLGPRAADGAAPAWAVPVGCWWPADKSRRASLPGISP